MNPPKRKNDLIYFPCYFEDPWRRDDARRYIEKDPTNRQRFTYATRDMLPEARAYIKSGQPYAQAKAEGKDANDHVLVTLNRLHVTDKHRRLLALRAGAIAGQLTWISPRSGKVMTDDYVFPSGRAAEDNAVIKRLNYKVDMKFVGALCVAFARREPTRQKLGLGPLFWAVHFSRMSEAVLDRLMALEPYVQW